MIIEIEQTHLKVSRKQILFFLSARKTIAANAKREGPSKA
jgi:hypothetical protein